MAQKHECMRCGNEMTWDANHNAWTCPHCGFMEFN